MGWGILRGRGGILWSEREGGAMWAMSGRGRNRYFKGRNLSRALEESGGLGPVRDKWGPARKGQSKGVSTVNAREG
jgi:hypothetical protein